VNLKFEENKEIDPLVFKQGPSKFHPSYSFTKKASFGDSTSHNSSIESNCDFGPDNLVFFENLDNIDNNKESVSMTDGEPSS
jgi:hypothetical protein